MSLRDQQIVIVGGTSGIGLATAKLFLAQGAQVTVASRSQEKINAALHELGPKAQGFAMDFQDAAQSQHFFETIGNFDHLIVTAAEGSSQGAFGSFSVDAAKAAFESKFWGQYATVKAALPFIRQSGSITLTSGAFAARPAKGASTLVAINSAIEGLGRALAMDLAPIRVNVVSPGVVNTPVFSGMDANSREAMFHQIAHSVLLQHVAEPEEIAEAYAYLASNTYTTGSVLQVEGGAILSGIG